MKILVHGWWYAYTMQRIATSPLNKVLITNSAGKQTMCRLTTMAPYTTGVGSTPAVFRGKCYYILIQKSITSEAPTDMKFYYQWKSNFSLKIFTRGRKQYAHYKTPEKNMSTEKITLR